MDRNFCKGNFSLGPAFRQNFANLKDLNFIRQIEAKTLFFETKSTYFHVSIFLVPSTLFSVKSQY
jgi:hypothetical protein